MGRSILAVLSGYLTMVVGVSGALAFAALVLLGEIPTDPSAFEPPASLLAVELVISLLAAVAGGYVCAWVARRQEVGHALALGGLMVVMGVISIVIESGHKPLWSSLAVPVLGLAGVWLGARLRLRHRES